MKKKRSRKKKLVKFLLIVTVIIALILAAGYFLLDQFKNEIVNYLVKKIEKNSGGLYSITYETIDIKLIKKSIAVKNLSIHLDREILEKITKESSKTRILFKTTRPVLNLKIEGISIFRLIFSNSIKINKLSVTDGEVAIIKIKKKTRGVQRKKKSKPIKSIFVKHLNVDKLSFKLIEPGKKNPVLTITDVSLLLSKLRIYLKSKAYPKTYIYFKSGEFILKEPAFTFPDEFYTFKAKRLNFSKSTSGSSISINSLELIPKYKKYRFSWKKGYQSNWLSLKIANIIFKDIDLEDLFKNQRFYSKGLIIEKPVLEIFRNKNVPKQPKAKEKKFPQQLLRDLKLPIRIDDTNIANGCITYSERAQGRRKPGTIFFKDIRANLKNLTNYPELLEKKISLVLNASTKVMGKSILKTRFSIPINHKNNFFTFSGSLGKMDMKPFNSMVVNNAHLRIDSGRVNKLSFAGRADRNYATGTMKFFYNNLKISVFKKSGKYKKRKFASFLANAIIYRNNPKAGKPLRIGKIFFKREKPIPFFTYLWRALLSGIKSSMSAFGKK